MYCDDQAFAVWRPPNTPSKVWRMTTGNATVSQIAKGHFADPDENSRSCRGCGRPWPCDVHQIVLALELEDTASRKSSQPKAPRLRPVPIVVSASPAPVLRPRARRTPATRAISP